MSMLARFASRTAAMRPASLARATSAIRPRQAILSAQLPRVAAPSISSMTRSFTMSNIPSLNPGHADSHKHLTEVFGENCFNERAQRMYLPPDVFKEVQTLVNTHQPIPSELTERFAASLHRWAVERGATHYTHYFTPLTNGSASKHDSFMQRSGDHVISAFSGKTLAILEPDASSFPNGGLRKTHEARGYTIWDPSSPAFVIKHGAGATLYVPAVFISWQGHSLDEKTPLLRSGEALNRQGLRMLHAAGQTEHSFVRTDSGTEQEFFLVDKDYVLKRPDILQTSRTLLGAETPRGQELNDNYFTDLSERTMEVINDTELELWSLGIPQTTRHKEVAPGQYEMAPVFSPVSVACDQNMLLMEVLRRVAHRHGMEALFHEKPFAGINGSGKHNNWSVGTDKIGTVFKPGKNPEQNLLFMLFLAVVIRGVHKFADLLRICVASASNDHRLGANEAPPAIVSIYLGDDITEAAQKFVKKDTTASKADKKRNLGFACLPEFSVDPTDRNRTSPFAFTGNKFEFRAVGSSQMCHRSSAFLNAISADSCRYIAEEIEARVGKSASQSKRQAAAAEVARETIEKHWAVVFNGDAYSEDWNVEAEKRGLPNLRTTPEALDELISEKNIEMFSSLNVLSEAEVRSRYNIFHEEYSLKLSMEAHTLCNLVNTSVLPAAYDMQTTLGAAISSSDSAGPAQLARLDKVNALVDGLVDSIDTLAEFRAQVHDVEDVSARSHFCKDNIVPQMEKVRTFADQLEELCDGESWTLPSYHDMLFTGQVYDVSPSGSSVL